MAIFRPKPWTNPFGKMSIFRLFELLVFIAEKGLYSFQTIIKHIFMAYIAEKKKRKMANFGPKPWTNPFGKMSIFRPFKILVFIVQKVDFLWQNTIKHIFLAYIGEKKTLEKWPILDLNHGLTRLEKCPFFDFLNFLFLHPRKAFFCSTIS